MANRFLSNIKINDAYTFPASDGTNGQVITTDGAGNLSFQSAGEAGATVIYKDLFTGDASTLAFTLANSVDNEVKTQVYFDGVYQSKENYTVSGSTITFSTAPPSGAAIEVITFATVAAADYNQKLNFYGKAVGTITKGDAVMFAGAQGDHFLIAKATQSALTANHEYFLGLAAHDFVNNQYGYVTQFGRLEAMDTSVYTTGDILWFDSEGTTAGAVTTTEPSAPNTKIQIAAVVRVHQEEGVIFVRPTVYHTLSEQQDVSVTSVADKDLLAWNTSTGVWENTKTLGNITTGNITTSGTVDGVDVSSFKSDYDAHNHDGRYYTETEVDTFLTNKTNWDTAYGWGDHSVVGYLTSFTETDPIYTASSWYTTTNNSTNWNTAYGWGNHASAGYLTSFTETDPIYTASSWYTTTNNSSNWNTAYTYSQVGHLPLAGGTLTGTLNGLGANFTDPVTIYDNSGSENPRLSVGRGATERLSFDVEDRVAKIYHVQDEGSGGHSMEFSINSADPSKTFYWIGKAADATSPVTFMTLNSSGITATGYNKSNWDTAYGWGNHSGLYLPLTGGTMTGQLIIGSASAATSPTLRVNTPTSSTFVHAQENIAANLTSGQHIINVVGKETNTKNSGYIGYYWAGNASDSNFVTIGHWGSDDLLRVYGNGNVTVSGNIASTIFYDSNNTNYYVDPASTSNLAGLTVGSQITGSVSGYATYAKRISDPVRTNFTVGGNSSTFYPISIYTGAGATTSQYAEFVIERGGYDDPGYSGIGFSTFNARFTYKPSGWGYGATYFNLEQLAQTAVCLADYQDYYQASEAIIWLRGGTTYWIYSIVGGITMNFSNPSGTNYAPTYATFSPTTSISSRASYARYFDSTHYQSGAMHSGTSMQAPIFYDINNTNYFLNPAETSEVSTIFAKSCASSPYSGSFAQYGAYGFSTCNQYSETVCGSGATLGVYSSNNYANYKQCGFNIDAYYGATYANAAIDTYSLNICNGLTGKGISWDATGGDLRIGGVLYQNCYSDCRYKSNITPIESALDKIDAIRGVEFDWNELGKEEANREGHEVGVIAQEVQSVYPIAVREVSSERSDKVITSLVVDYDKLIPLLVQSIKELKARIEILENGNN